MDEGYWPSLDPSEPGYIGTDKTAADLEREMKKARLRYNRWLGDAWHYIGVVARASVYIPVGGTSFHVLEVDSAGVWGIESDNRNYLREVYAEERAELRSQFETFAKAFLAGDLLEDWET